MQDGLYAADRSAQTYAHLATLAREVLAAGWPVILDGTFLRRAQRQAMRALADAAGVPFAILWPDSPADVMRERIAQRATAGGDPSEATVDVLARQLVAQEALTEDEVACAVRVRAGDAMDGAALARRVAEVLGQR